MSLDSCDLPASQHNTLSALDLLDSRRSLPARQLAEPGPDPAILLRMLRSAVRVPDHGKLAPFRFLRIAGTARAALGDFLVERCRQQQPQASVATLDKERQRFNQAPLVLTVVARLQPQHKVPLQEQWLSAGCVCFALLQAAQGCGFGAQWLTGWAAHDPAVAAHLGLGEHERIAGFIHIGTATATAVESVRPDPATLLSDWNPADA